MKTKNLPLIIGLLLPVIFILIISVVIFVPTLFIKPQHDFLYTTEDARYYSYREYNNTYKIENNHIALELLPTSLEQSGTIKKAAPILYMYDVKNNSSHQITFEQAESYFLDPGPSSPDGYSINYNYENDGIFELFGSGDNNNNYFISKGKGKKKLNGLVEDKYWNPGNFKLIGWIK